MKAFLLSVLILGFSLVCVRAAENPPITFHIQLIRGVNDSTQPTPDAKPIDTKLNDRLHSTFKWVKYWEINYQTVDVAFGKKSRKRMSAEREVEIELVSTNQMAIRIFRNGTQTFNLRQSPESQFAIAGGSRDDDQSWFVVVRRDKPTRPLSN